MEDLEIQADIFETQLELYEPTGNDTLLSDQTKLFHAKVQQVCRVPDVELVQKSQAARSYFKRNPLDNFQDLEQSSPVTSDSDQSEEDDDATENQSKEWNSLQRMAGFDRTDKGPSTSRTTRYMEQAIQRRNENEKDMRAAAQGTDASETTDSENPVSNANISWSLPVMVLLFWKLVYMFLMKIVDPNYSTVVKTQSKASPTSTPTYQSLRHHSLPVYDQFQNTQQNENRSNFDNIL